MINIEDLKLTKQDYANYKANLYGGFKFTDSQDINFAVTKADQTIDELALQKVIDAVSADALGKIKRVYPIFSTRGLGWDNLAAYTQTGLKRAVMAQAIGSFADGAIEIKTDDTISGGDAQAQRQATSVLITTDRIYQQAEDEISDFNIDQLVKHVLDDGTVVLMDEAGTFATVFASGENIKEIAFVGSDKYIMSQGEVQKAIAQAGIQGRPARGTYEAASKADYENIDATFKANGVTLTNGEVLTTGNVAIGENFYVEVPSVQGWQTETVVWNGTKLFLTQNNELREVLLTLAEEIQAEADAKADKEDVILKDGSVELPADYTSENKPNAVVKWNDVQRVKNALMQLITSLEDDTAENKAKQIEQQAEIDTLKEIAQDYTESKAEFLRVGDLVSTIKIPLTPGLPIVDAGDGVNVKVVLTGTNLSLLKDGSITDFILSNGTNRINIRDQFNDGQSTDTTIQGFNFDVSSTVDQLITTGLSGASKPNLLTSYNAAQITNNNAVATISVNNPLSGSSIGSYTVNEDVTIEFTNAFGAAAGGVITLPWGETVNGYSLTYTYAQGQTRTVPVTVTASVNGIVVTFASTTDRTNWTSTITGYPFIIKQDGFTSLHDLLIGHYQLILITQLDANANAGIDQTARDEATEANAATIDAKNKATAAQQTADQALAKATDNARKVVNPDLLEVGKDYIVRPVANANPVYYEIDAVAKQQSAALASKKLLAVTDANGKITGFEAFDPIAYIPLSRIKTITIPAITQTEYTHIAVNTNTPNGVAPKPAGEGWKLKTAIATGYLARDNKVHSENQSVANISLLDIKYGFHDGTRTMLFREDGTYTRNSESGDAQNMELHFIIVWEKTIPAQTFNVLTDN